MSLAAVTPAQARPAGAHRSGGSYHHHSSSRHVNVDVDIHHHHGYGYHRYHYHPVARATTAAVVMGHYYRTLPASCVTAHRGTLIYYHCGTVWYRHAYYGGGVRYLVVTAP